MEFIKKHWQIITFIIAFIVDNQYDILTNLVKDQHTIDVIKAIGALLLAIISPKYINFDKK